MVVTKQSSSNLSQSLLKFNSLLKEACDEKCLTSPSLWSQMCQHFNVKALVLDQFNISDLNQIHKELQPSQMIHIVYVYRDPRAVLWQRLQDQPSLKLEAEASNFCQSLARDLQQIDLHPKAAVRTISFEDFVLRPSAQMADYALSSFCNSEDRNINQKDAAIDDWKLKWSIDDIVLIEDKCAQVLNRLEYPLYGLVS